MLRIAALTMVRNDEKFLRKWVDYYASQFGKENLFIWLDGLDQAIPDFCKGTNIQAVKHKSGTIHKADKLRIDFLSLKAAELFKTYDIVIGTDVDEFLVVDSLLNVSLADFLSNYKTKLTCISGLGIDVGQNLNCEQAIDWDKPLLSQRSYAKLSTRYSKTNVLLKPAQWGSGFHRVRNANFHIAKGLYLFHFGCVDLARLAEKSGDALLAASGWSKHLKKRAKTITAVCSHKAHNWDKTVGIARVIQNIFRPPYAWNKPAMFEAVIIVKIPERFIGIV